MRTNPPKNCSSPNCNNRYHSKGYCKYHYHRLRNDGTLVPSGEVVRRCTLAECDKPYYTRGYCKSHYSRLHRLGEIKPLEHASKCAASECDKPPYGKGYCEKHYMRLWRNGDVGTVFPPGKDPVFLPEYRCPKCGEMKAVEEFRGAMKEGKRGIKLRRQGYCKACESIKQMDERRLLSQQIKAAYGDACTCCGETEPMFLTVDHINGDGASHRKEIGTTGLYAWLRRHNFPRDNFRLLCRNCNVGRYLNGGICPHEAHRSAVEVRVEVEYVGIT